MSSSLPARPSLEQLRKRAKDLLRAMRAGDPDAAERFGAADSRWSAHAHHANAILADAQLVIAREHGFASWSQLVHHIEATGGNSEALRTPLIRPIDLLGERPYTLADGTTVTRQDVYDMFVAARAGDLAGAKALLARAPALATVEYNYTPPIHFAAREGHLAIVKLLIERGADLGYRSYPFGESLLTLAEDHEHTDVTALLRRHLAARFAMRAGTKEIIDAARAGDLARVQSELERDPSLARGSNETGDTALHHAAHNAHLDIMQILLDAGADADAVRGDGYRPIHLALMPNWLIGAPQERTQAVVNALLARGVRYTTYIAALRGDDEFVRNALRADSAAANEEDSCHHRPLSAATRRNDIDMVRLLLDHGADPNAPEEGAPRGHALWLAVHNRSYELTRLLLERGADPNGMVDSSGTPLDMARGDAHLYALLMAHGGIVRDTPRDHVGKLLASRKFDEAERMVRASPDLLHDEGGEGILMGPASAGDHEMIAFLMRLGARVPLVTKWAPYYYFKHEATAAFLLEHGMDPNHMNWHRFTLLHHMAAEGELNKARLLLDYGANIDAIDEEYRSTPLGVAARRGQLELAAFLLERGADPGLAGARWATPMAWAHRRDHQEIVDILTRAGVS